MSVDALKRFALSEELGDRISKQIADVPMASSYPSGAEIFHEGDKAKAPYLRLKAPG